MNEPCIELNAIAELTRRNELNELMSDLAKGAEVLHVLGPRGIGKRTLLKCLAHEISLNDPGFSGIFLIDLPSQPLVVQEWDEGACNWKTSENKANPIRSVTGALDVLFPNDAEGVRTSGTKTQKGAGIDTPIEKIDPKPMEHLAETNAGSLPSAESLALPDSTGKPDDNPKENEPIGDVHEPAINRVKSLLVLKDYENHLHRDPALGESDSESDKTALERLQDLIRDGRIRIVLMTEEALTNRRFATHQRLENYRSLYETAKSTGYMVGLFSEKNDALSAIRLLYQSERKADNPKDLNDDQLICILKAAGPHPEQIELAVRSFLEFSALNDVEQKLVNEILRARLTHYDATWGALQEWERAVLMTYALMQRGKKSRSEAQSQLENCVDDFHVSREDFAQAEQRRGVPISAVGQCLLPWGDPNQGDLFSGSFVEFVHSKILRDSSELHVLERARTAPFILLAFMATLLLSSLMLIVATLIDQQSPWLIAIPMVPIVILVVLYIWSHFSRS